MDFTERTIMIRTFGFEQHLFSKLLRNYISSSADIRGLFFGNSFSLDISGPFVSWVFHGPWPGPGTLQPALQQRRGWRFLWRPLVPGLGHGYLQRVSGRGATWMTVVFRWGFDEEKFGKIWTNGMEMGFQWEFDMI